MLAEFVVHDWWKEHSFLIWLVSALVVAVLGWAFRKFVGWYNKRYDARMKAQRNAP